MRRNRALECWTPEEEEAEFLKLCDRYERAIVEHRDTAALDDEVDRAVAAYFGRGRRGCSDADVGAAEGWATNRLRELGFDAIGVERNPAVAKHAASADLVVVGNAEDLPLEDESRDFVVCNSIFEHVLNPEKVVAEVARVLKPGGVAVLSSTNRWNPKAGEIGILFFPWMPYALREYLWRRSSRGHISPHFFSYGDLRRMARAHGLEYESAISVLLSGPKGSSRKRRVATALYRIAPRFLMDASRAVVQVRLVKP